ncbi:hypothetical protein NC652_039860 [Populus alba x Populus x berolinensis]|nr:hypothetical protein NC652_039860 [Populus alba x Populus x berolinensis]
MDLERSSLSLIAQLLSVFFLSAKDLIQILHDRVQEESKNDPTKPPVNHSSPRPSTPHLDPSLIFSSSKLQTPFCSLSLSLSLSLPYIYIYISWLTKPSASQNPSFLFPFCVLYFSFIPHLYPQISQFLKKPLKIPRPVSPIN